MATFRQCPARFKIHYLDGVSKPDESIEAFTGSRVHEALDHLYSRKMDGQTPMLDELLDVYLSKWQSHWHDRIAIANRQYTEEGYYRIGERCISWYYRTYVPFGETSRGTEVPIEFTLDNENEIRFIGIIDRLDYVGDGIWEIHDYKTGKRALSQTQADNDRQLALYQIGLERVEPGVKEVRLVWHFLQSGIRRESQRTRPQLTRLINSLKSDVSQILDRIELNGEFPPRESRLCDWCYFWEECPAKSMSNPHIKNGK